MLNTLVKEPARLVSRMGLYACVLAFFISFTANAEQRNFALEVEKGDFSSSTTAAVKHLLQNAEALLPPTLKNQIGRKITVRFKKLGEAQKLAPPACPSIESSGDLHHKNTIDERKWDQVFGEVTSTQPDVIWLNYLLIPIILKGPTQSETYKCGFKSMYRLALATVIHELAHLADTVSSKRYYRKIANWKGEGILGTYRPRNRLAIRSPDVYETLNLQEHFAVNLTYFLLDPEYSCRRPSLSLYFQKMFRFRPETQCELNTKVPVSSFHLGSDEEVLTPINLDKIAAIDFFPALKGNQIASRWGHSMFRIVMCNPNRSVDLNRPEEIAQCRKDINYHIVVSFSAYIENPSLSAWKGLTGEYPSQVFLMSLEQALEKYTQIELREMWSLPLILTQAQKRLFVLRVLELYYEYQRPYKFLTNNCVHESVDFIKGVIDEPSMHGFSPYTPKSMIKKLAARNLLNLEVLRDKTEAQKKGYLFPSQKEALEKAFSDIQTVFIKKGLQRQFVWKSVWNYLSDSKPSERKAVIELLKYDSFKILAAVGYIESRISSEKRLNLKAKMVTLLETLAKAEDSEHAVEKELYQSILKVTRDSLPMKTAKKGYGIPLKSDFEENYKYPQLSKETILKLEEWKKQHYSEEIEELDQITANGQLIENLIATTIELL